MKVLVINWRDVKNPEAGGAEIHIDEILKRKPKSWNVDFVSASFKGCKPEERINGYNVVRIPNNSLFNFTFRSYWDKVLSKKGYDLIIDDISKIPLATPLYIKTTPILAIQHHIHGKSLFKQLVFPMAFYVYNMEKYLLRHYVNTPLVAVSESTRDDLKKHYPFKKIVVSHNGIDFKSLNKGYKNSNTKKPVVLYFGRMKKYKRIEHILLAFRAVRRAVPGAELWLAGKGDHEPVLRKAAADLDLAGSVKFLGFVSEKEKLSVFSRSALSVITSEKEGWGISVIESNAAGVPVIGYDVEGVRDSVRNNDTGILVPNGDVEKLAFEIVRLLNDKKSRDRLSKASVRWASGFSWDNMARDFYKIANEVLIKLGQKVTQKAKK